MKFFVAILFCLCALSNTTEAKSRLTAELLLRHGIAVRLPEPKIFYRWQSEKSANNLLRHGKLTARLFDYFMDMRRLIASGPGLYVAMEPFSSAQYGTNLIEVILDIGAPIVDLRNRSIHQKLERLGYSYDDLKKTEGIAVVYEDVGWTVLRLRDFVSFRPVRNPNEILLRGNNQLSKKAISSLKQQILRPLNDDSQFIAELAARGIRPTEIALRLRSHAGFLDIMPFVEKVGRARIIEDAQGTIFDPRSIGSTALIFQNEDTIVEPGLLELFYDVGGYEGLVDLFKNLPRCEPFFFKCHSMFYSSLLNRIEPLPQGLLLAFELYRANKITCESIVAQTKMRPPTTLSVEQSQILIECIKELPKSYPKIDLKWVMSRQNSIQNFITSLFFIIENFSRTPDNWQRWLDDIGISIFLSLSPTLTDLEVLEQMAYGFGVRGPILLSKPVRQYLESGAFRDEDLLSIHDGSAHIVSSKCEDVLMEPKP